MQAGQRNLGGGHQVQVLLVVLVQVVGELGQLARAEDRLGLDHEGQVAFLVALAAVQVQHERDQGALQLRAGAVQHIESRAGDLGAALEVDDAKRRSQIPVWLRRESQTSAVRRRS